MKKTLFLGALLVLCAGLVFSQNKLSMTDKDPTIDGTISDGEYSLAMPFTGMMLYVNWTKDHVSAAIRANTSGWVGIGTGSLQMNGASIYIGYLDANGKPVFAEQTGRFHSHSDAQNPLPVKYAITENNGVTIMEISLPTADVIPAGATKLLMITAYGRGDNITEHHEFRTPVSIDLAQ